MMVYERFRDTRKFESKAETYARGSRRKKELIMGQTEYGELDEARNRLGLIFLFAIETGMQLGEICNLDWHNIHLRHSYLQIESSKNGGARDIPLSSRAVELLERIKSHSRSLIHERTITNEF